MEPHSLAKSVDVEVSSRHTKKVIESMMNVPFIYLSISPKVSLTLVIASPITHIDEVYREGFKSR